MKKRNTFMVVLVLFASLMFQVYQPVLALGGISSRDNNSTILMDLDENTTHIYLDGLNGDDLNDGSTKDLAVKTFERAKQIAADYQNINTIYVIGTVIISEEITLEGTKAILKRDAEFNGYLLQIEYGTTATLRNISIDGNSQQAVNANSSLIRCLGTLNITEGTVLENNIIASKTKRTENLGGAVYCEGKGCTVNMTGGIVQNNAAMWGGGFYVTENATLNVSGGTIKNNNAYTGPGFNRYNTNTWDVSGAGGGICLFDGATCNISGKALIQSNNSEEVGGGISVGTIKGSLNGSNRLVMDGGTIDKNTSGAGGGGILVQAAYYPLESTATINAGYITNNIMTGDGKTNSAFGGGGIYVNGSSSSEVTNGKLILMNAIVTNNTARIYGGGYAACPISDTKIYLSDSGAIYGNKANYYSRGKDLFIYAQTQGYGSHGGNPEFFISDSMLGCAPYHWKNYDGTEVPLNGLKGVLLGEGVALLLHTDEVADEITLKLARVFITGNYSKTAGGGIGSNGDVIFGFYEETFDLYVSKVWDDDDNLNELRPEKIEIELWRKTAGTSEEPVYVGYETITPDANGNWSMKFNNLHKKDGLGNEFEYIIKERPVTGYVTTIEQQASDRVLLTNTIETKRISIEGSKTWIDDDDIYGKRPESITIHLFENEKKIDSITVTEQDGWAWKFEDLPKYKNGELIVYTITEDEIVDYTTEIEGYNITNTFKHVVPETGDSFNPFIWIGLMMASFIAIVVLLVYRKKNRY